MTGVALRPATKQLIAGLFLRRELRFAREYCVVFRSELRYFGRSFVAGDRLCHLIKSDTGPAARRPVFRALLHSVLFIFLTGTVSPSSLCRTKTYTGCIPRACSITDLAIRLRTTSLSSLFFT